MVESIVAEGKTTAEAIENGLKQLNVNKEKVEVKVLENEKRSFFSILAPRIVKVELKLKENEKNIKGTRTAKINSKQIYNNQATVNSVTNKMKEFLDDLIKKLPSENITYEIKYEERFLKIKLNGTDLRYLIGYRGETLNALQIVINAVANKHTTERVNVLLDIGEYRKERQKVLEDLAVKLSKVVLKTKKKVTLEPMIASERRIIHNKLQQTKLITTYSVGEEPHRRVVINLK